MKSFKIFFVTLAFGSTAFAETLPSINCFDVLNASPSVSIKTFQLLSTPTRDKKIYLANVKVFSNSNIENPAVDTLEVDVFYAGRRSGFTYSINRQDGTEISLQSSCLYAPNVCASPSFTGKITESSGAIQNLTCKFE